MKLKNTMMRIVTMTLFLIAILGMLSCGSIDPSKPEVKAIRTYNEGVKAKENNDYPTALAYFEKAIEINPLLWQAYENAGLILAEHEKYEQAIDILKEGLKADPNNIKIHFNIALCFYKLGESEKSYAYFKKIYKIDPTYQFGKNNYLQFKFVEDMIKDAHPILLLPEEKSRLAEWKVNHTSQLILIKHVPPGYPTKGIDEKSKYVMDFFFNPVGHNLPQENVMILSGEYLHSNLLDNELDYIFSYASAKETFAQSVVVVVLCPEEVLNQRTFIALRKNKRKLRSDSILIHREAEADPLEINILKRVEQFAQAKINFYFALFPVKSEITNETPKEDIPASPPKDEHTSLPSPSSPVELSSSNSTDLPTEAHQ